MKIILPPVSVRGTVVINAAQQLSTSGTPSNEHFLARPVLEGIL